MNQLPLSEKRSDCTNPVPTRKAKVPEISKPVKKALRKMWIDGNLWIRNDILSKLLSAMLQDATGDSRPVEAKSWTQAAGRCHEWTNGVNKGPASMPGSFQKALLSIRAVGILKANIIGHWTHAMKTCHLARAKYNSDAILANVDDQTVEYYIMKLNHELQRTNCHSTKKSAPNRVQWYTSSVPFKYRRPWVTRTLQILPMNNPQNMF